MLRDNHRFTHGLLLLIACLSAQPLPAQSPAELGLLRLAGGDHVPGWLADSDDLPGEAAPEKLGWWYPEFSSPLQFELSSVIEASFPKPPNARLASGMHAIELVQGDRLYGEIVSADDWTVRVLTADFGELTVLRSAIKRVSMWDDGASMTFVGPGSIEQWKTGGAAGAWQSAGGQLRTEQSGATAFRNIGLPNHAIIESELSWEGQPNFVLAIGVDAKNSDQSNAAAFRIEVWEGEVVLLRELDEVAEVISLGSLDQLDGVLRLSLELHQNEGRLLARSAKRELLGEFTLRANDFPDVQPGVRLTNLRGDVSFRSFSVMQVSANPERESTNSPATLYLTDGSVKSGRWTATHGQQWEFSDGQSTRWIDANQIVSIELASDDPPRLANETSNQDLKKKRNVQAAIVSHGDVRLAGRIRAVGDGRVNLQHDAIVETISFKNDQIARLSVEGSQRGELADSKFILGRLVFPGGRLTGQLIDTDDQSDPTPIRLSFRGANAVHLNPGFTGRMVYRETPPAETAKQRRVREQREAAQRRAVQQRQNRGGVWNVLTRAFGNNEATDRGMPVPRSMHLRSGEVIPCEVEAIDENGILFKSEMTDQTRLPADQVRAIAFTAGCRDPEVEAARRDRLLTVPRVRKKNRPTHLIVATNDDMLRCRLIKLDKDELLVETRLEKIAIKRSVVAQIIWLKEDTEDEPESETDVPPTNELATRAVLRNGNRMSLIVTSIQDSIVIGEHPLLGESRIKLGDVNELLIGIDINEPGENQPYNSWQLRDAPEPIIPEAGEGGAGPSGMSSSLVGKEAPDFTLDLLDGGRFNVADQRGTVVVLDFWATWCGPCLQAMPVIEKTVAQFDENDVRLVAVNLQETAEPIRGTLARLNVSPEVALDIDGVAAARYQADAIPQTVVIGRDGKITRLFVGGGPQLAEALREAIAAAVQASSEE